ncbi:MAG: TonB-dependent receptor plug domain-containing protein, partial [Bacteroidales bacterium]|nr:TonB-dependent receptor plug domain-containing protein [Bacteroidales bacterium]
MKKLLFIITMCLTGLTLSAQQVHKVTGQVTDVNGEPIIGVGVLIEGTTIGVVTDYDGNYEINVPEGAKIVYSSLGYVTQTVVAGNQAIINMVLGEDTQLLEESVVVGYSVQKKRDVLGAVSKVDGKDLTKMPVSSVQETLQGRVAGVEVTSQTGAPGASVSVRVRGTSSISSSNEPLYIVDGIPVEGALNNISPNDIENISVLKDASSAAIYGSRATNGVVLITTKSGKAGTAKISYNMQAGVQTHGHLTEMANTEEYIKIYNEAATADNAVSGIKRPLIEGTWLKDFPNVNHLKEIFQVAPIHSHELSV